MDTLSNYSIRTHRFITWFFRLLLLFAATVVVLLVVLKINDTVSVRDGQVVAANPQINFISPFDAEVVTIYVREGQPVKKGDTLLRLRNVDLLQQQARTATEISYLQDKIASGKKDLSVFRDYEMQLVQLQETAKKIESDLNKLTLVASVPGTVNFVFNTLQATNVIERGEVLVSIAPQNDRYYAKLYVAEKDLPTVKVGMPVQLKADAYQGAQHGRVTGRVTYVSERKQDDKFFALVDLDNNASFPLRAGYSLRGDVVLQQLPLYKYFLKKLFRSVQ